MGDRDLCQLEDQPIRSRFDEGDPTPAAADIDAVLRFVAGQVAKSVDDVLHCKADVMESFALKVQLVGRGSWLEWLNELERGVCLLYTSDAADE